MLRREILRRRIFLPFHFPLDLRGGAGRESPQGGGVPLGMQSPGGSMLSLWGGQCERP